MMKSFLKIFGAIVSVAFLWLGWSYVRYIRDVYGGFTYRLDSLRRLGVRNIELKEWEWHPERHPDFKEVYEVTYP